MKSVLEVCLAALAVTAVTGAQDTSKPVLHPGVQVQMPVANHAIEMRAADQNNATVVSVTSDGEVFLGVEPVTIAALSRVKAPTVYLKADARVEYQRMLAVLDALRGRSVVLLTAPALHEQKGETAAPYGLELRVNNQ